VNQEYELPPGWEWEDLGELGTWAGGGTPSKANKVFWENGSIPWVSPKDMKFGRIRTAEDWITEEAVRQSSAKHIPANSILMVTRSGILAHTFPVAVNDCAVTVNQDLKALTPFECADPDFLTWYLRAQNFRILKDCAKHGTTVASIDSDRLKKFSVPIAPLNEQRRIVEKIETLFARLDKGKEALREVSTLLARYRQSVLKAAVTGQLTGSNPATWKPVTLGDLLEDIRYGTAKKCRPDVAGVAVLRIPNVANGEIDLRDLKYTQLDDREVKTLGLREGDLLIVRSNGSASLVGRGAVVNDDAVGFAFAGYLIRLRVDRSLLLPDFLQLVMSSPVVRARIERQARSTNGVHNINSGEVKAIAFDLPPLDVQAEIIELVDEHMAKINDLEAWCQTELTRSTALRQSILKDAFAGRIAPQDPTDEPAAALLARIRETRAAAPRKTSRKTRA